MEKIHVTSALEFKPARVLLMARTERVEYFNGEDDIIDQDGEPPKVKVLMITVKYELRDVDTKEVYQAELFNDDKLTCVEVRNRINRLMRGGIIANVRISRLSKEGNDVYVII